MPQNPPDRAGDWSLRLLDLSRPDRPDLAFRSWRAVAGWLELVPQLAGLFAVQVPADELPGAERDLQARKPPLKLTVIGDPGRKRGLRTGLRAGVGHMSTIRLAAFLVVVTIRAREEAMQ